MLLRGFLNRVVVSMLFISAIFCVFACSKSASSVSEPNLSLGVTSPAVPSTGIPHQGGVFVVPVYSNTSWGYSTAQNFCSVRLDGFSWYTAAVITVGSNPTDSPRRVEVVFTASGSGIMIRWSYMQEAYDPSLEPAPSPVLSLSSVSPEVEGALSSEGSVHTIMVESNYTWEAVCAMDFCQLKLVDGGVQVTVLPNALVESRPVEVNFVTTSGLVDEATATWSAVQAGSGPYLNISSVSPEVPQSGVPILGDIYTLSVVSNVEWSASTESEGCAVVVSDNMVVVTVSENLSFEPRSVEVVITSPHDAALTDTWSVSQLAPVPFLELGQSDPQVPAAGVPIAGATYFLPVQSNVEWSVSASENCEVAQVEGGLSVTISENSTFEPRLVEVVVTSPHDAALTETWSVSQLAPVPFLELGQSDPQVPAAGVPIAGATYFLPVQSNVEWSVSASENCEVAQVEGGLSVTISENLTAYPVAVKVEINAVQYEMTATWTVNQLPAEPFIEFATCTPEVPVDGVPVLGAQYTLAVTSNSKWNVGAVSEGVETEVQGDNLIVTILRHTGLQQRTVSVELSTEVGAKITRWEAVQLKMDNDLEGLEPGESIN